MTTPVTADDLIQGAVKRLATEDAVLAVLGNYPGTVTPWLFQHTLWVAVEGTGSTAAVISRAGGWAGPNTHNTMKFPRIALEVYVDPQRDATFNVTDPGEAARRAEYAFAVVDMFLHRPQTGVQMWGSVRTLGCTRLAEPVVYPVPDGGGLLRLAALYGVTQG